MRQIKSSFLLLFTLLSSSIFAQSVGDTIVVSALNYQSSTRAVVVNFPIDTTISFEKVIMRYAMRCKNGLVSPPVTGQTNIGCGEWDYSCNTYITDSTRADSTLSSIGKYDIYPDTNSRGNFSTSPTWNAYPIIQQTVNIQSIINEDTTIIGQGTLTDSTSINSIGTGGKTYILLSASELLAAGLLAGDIDGFNFTNVGSANTLLNFKVKMKESNLNNLSFPDSADFTNIQEVYFHNYNAVVGNNRVAFKTPFNWNGTSNLLLELSYKPQVGNNKVQLEAHTTSAIQTMASSNDLAFNFFPNNYVEATGYKAISGANPRTIEAWIKTSAAGDEIVSWGTNSSGQKFVFRLDGSGKLRVEVNGGNIIGTTVLNDNKWHHVAVTFSGSSMYHFRFYVDGVRDNPTAINNVAVNTGQSLSVQISRGFHGRYWQGNIDNVRVWSTNLADTTLAKWRYRSIDNTHPNYSNLELDYSIESQNSTIIDNSPHGRNGQFISHNSFSSFTGDEHFKSFSPSNIRPNLSLYQGNYSLSVVNDTVVDTVYTQPYSVTENTIYPKYGTVFSDSIGIINNRYWHPTNTLFDLNGNVVSSSSSSNIISIVDTTLSYFSRSASKLELMSFVTPYGINLDLGIEGKAWYFDVSDFMPVLKGPRRITLERGGQWQEEMDIQFLFIVGTPPRDVKAIDQIWPVSSRSYTLITNDTYFAPKTLNLDTSAAQYKLRSVITGHGQQGEFIARNHFLNINGGPIEFNWNVWKECAENPVFPQGGTWIYDRAGWCPGMPSDVEEYDITNLVGNSSTVNIDYGVSTASGDSRYIVNNQLISYGPANFNLDARILEVISPTDHIEYGKHNPVCSDVEIKLQNSGATTLTSAVIQYSVNNGITNTFNWSGNLSFMEDTTFVIPTTSQFWAQLGITNTFTAQIVSANGVSDDYSANDIMIREFTSPPVLPPSFIFQFTTNAAAAESSYNLRDDAGALLFQRTSMNNNTTYRDTFNLPMGCYSINVLDSDDDGISFFGNNNGNGSLSIKEINGSNVQTFNPDYGDGFSYNFTISSPVGIDEQKLGNSISIYPNPTNSLLNIETTGLNNTDWKVFDQLARTIESGRLTNDSHDIQFSIDVSNYSEGLYFIQFIKEGVSYTQEFIVAD